MLYSPDGSRLASGGGDKAVRFWNTVTHMPQHTCLGHRDHVLCTGGCHLRTATWSLFSHSHSFLSPVWSPDGLTFVSADKSGEIRLWDPKTGTAKVPLRPVPPSLLLVSSSLLLVPSFHAYPLPLSPDVRRQGPPLRGHKKWVTSLAFEPLHADPSCTRLASSSKDHTVRQGQGYPKQQMHFLLRLTCSQRTFA